MNQRTRVRHILLIVIAIVLPAAVLVGLTRRVLRQERELAAARATASRRNALEQLRREFSARLEAVKLQEVNRWIRAPNAPDIEPASDSALVFVAAIDGDRMILPWESSPRPVPNDRFPEARRRGESLEFVSKDMKGALAAYRQAQSIASRGDESCEATLLEARVLTKVKQPSGAASLYRRILKSCDQWHDDDGIPFSLYAADRLINAIQEPGEAFAHVFAWVRQTRWPSPYQAYLLRSLLKGAPGEEGVAARNTIERRLVEIEQIMLLARELPHVRPLAATAWVAYGSEPWLINVADAESPLPSLVFAVSSAAASRKFTASAADVVAKNVSNSEPLGDGFIGVNVRWNADQFTARSGNGAYVYAGGIAFIVAVTVLAAYLLLRDVNRELRVVELRSNFVASVSHELKTPLTAIRMFAETLALGRAADERTRSEYLETIVNESERLARLVDNVLDFSKIEKGKKIYRMQPVRLADVVQSAARAVQYPLSQQGFELRVCIDESVDLIAADADAIQQAILNLLSNAIKYSGSDRRLEMSMKSETEEAVIEVTDHGIGIEPQEQPRIFEKFYRGRSAAAAMVAGTGLGLTVVQHIVQAHGGSVGVRSSPGEGSTFSIRLPLPATPLEAQA